MNRETDTKKQCKKTTGKQKKTMDNSAWYSNTNFTATSKIALFTISTTSTTLLLLLLLLLQLLPIIIIVILIIEIIAIITILKDQSLVDSSACDAILRPSNSCTVT